MRKLTKVLAMVLVLVVMISAVPVGAQAATKTITLSSKGYKKVSYVKKTGEYQLKFRCKEGANSSGLYAAFTAPSKGTYVIQLSKLYLKGQSVEESICCMGVKCYSELAFSGFATRWHAAAADKNNPVFIQNGYSGSPFVSASYWDICYNPETGKSEDGSGIVSKSLKVKCKLKKGESVYFGFGGLTENTGASGCFDDKTGYCTMTVEKR